MDSNVRAGSSPAPSTEKNLNNLFNRKLRFSFFYSTQLLLNDLNYNC